MTEAMRTRLTSHTSRIHCRLDPLWPDVTVMFVKSTRPNKLTHQGHWDIYSILYISNSVKFSLIIQEYSPTKHLFYVATSPTRLNKTQINTN